MRCGSWVWLIWCDAWAAAPTPSHKSTSRASRASCSRLLSPAVRVAGLQRPPLLLHGADHYLLSAVRVAVRLAVRLAGPQRPLLPLLEDDDYW